MRVIRILILISIAFGTIESASQTMYIPDEELPSESTTPRLDSPAAVINRKIQTKNRWQTQFRAGMLLDEVIYEPSYFAAGISYQTSEISGWGIFYQKFGSGFTDSAKSFESTNARLKLDRAPMGPTDGVGLSYFHRFFYGKVSFSQTTTLPLIIQSQFDLGAIRYGSQGLPFISAGVGPTLFVDSNWAFELQGRTIVRQAIDPLSQSLRSASPVPTDSSFNVNTRVGFDIFIGTNFLF